VELVERRANERGPDSNTADPPAIITYRLGKPALLFPSSLSPSLSPSLPPFLSSSLLLPERERTPFSSSGAALHPLRPSLFSIRPCVGNGCVVASSSPARRQLLPTASYWWRHARTRPPRDHLTISPQNPEIIVCILSAGMHHPLLIPTVL
jgi:hypothetical protein